jgi:hypothetical protein
MSISSTGIYGVNSTIVTSDLYEDVEQLKTNLTTLTTSHLSVASNHDGRLDILETDNTTNKSNITTLTTDNTTNKTNITGNTSRISTLETDNTTNKTNISTHTTQIGSLQLYDTSFNLRLQTLEGTEGSPANISLGVPAIPSTGLIAMAGSIALATAACIGLNGVSALAYIDSVNAKVDSNTSGNHT